MTRRVGLLLLILLVTLAFLAGFLVYAAVTREAEYARLVDQGQSALGADQTDLAIEAFSGAIALKTDSMLAYLKRGETYRQRGELEAALRDLRVAARLDPTAPRPLEQLGDVNYGLSRFARATESYEAYVALDERSFRVLYKLGLSRYRRGDHVGAVTALGDAIKLFDRFPEAHYLLGLCQAEMNRPDDAVASLQRALGFAPGLTPAREALAALYRRAKNEAGAIEQLEAIAALEPNRPERLVAVGLAHARAGRTDLAVLRLGNAAERHPNQPDVYIALARIWLDAADARYDRVAVSKALEALDRVTRGPSATSESLTLLGRALALNGDLAEARRVLQQASTRLPVDPASFAQLASVSQRQGDIAAARAALVGYAAVTPDERDVGRVAPQIAEWSLRLSEPADAVHWYTRAIELGGETPAALARLADAQIRAGNLADARATVARGLRKDPRNPSLLAVSRRLPS
jgi:tetratricopeptide (TPR) repeat protein